ncbi:MAG: hypothetical protein JSU00_10090 [Acidobacteria bacterium]|nr:hypothetical protein [Acidobacteriota bacterium]
MAVSHDERESVNSAEELAEAIEPVVEHSLRLSIRNDPRVLAGVLFPVIGPAIRKAVSAALSDMVESLNRILENSFSTRVLGWRFTAWRTGRPFAEIALLHSLIYRVEQVLLIHRPSGLLLAHVQGPAVAGKDSSAAQDNSMVSGMLTAIQDFVQESFSPGAETPLRTMDAGDLTVWLEQGPNATLATVIRGAAPPELRHSMAGALESIQQRHARDLAAFEGDNAAFERCQPMLEECLAAKYRPPARPAARPLWIVAALLAVLGGVWLYFSMRSANEWRRALSRLQAEPGIMVVSSERAGGRYHVAGLRDPLAADPRRVLAAAGVDPAKIDASWRAFCSLDSAIAEKRARIVLQPPAGVVLASTGGVLDISGTAPHFWISGALKAAPAIPGVDRVRIAGLVDADMDSSRIALESAIIRFAEGSAEIQPAEALTLQGAAKVAATLEAEGRGIARSVSITVLGRADGGTPSPNNPNLAAARAAGVMKELIRQGVSAGVLKMDSAVDARTGAGWRNVTFAVAFGEGAEAGSR